MKKTYCTLSALICAGLVGTICAEKRTLAPRNEAKITITSEIRIDKNALSEKAQEELIRQAKEDGKGLNKKYAKMRGVRVATSVNADGEEEEEEDCGCGGEHEHEQQPAQEEDCGCSDSE